MASTDVQSKIGTDDIKFATGGTGAIETFTRRTSTGGTLTLEKVDATHLMLRAESVSAEAAISRLPQIDYIGNYTSLTNAVSVIGESNVMLLINVATTVTGDLTVPKNITLWVSQEGLINIATDKTLTINGSLEAGLYQIFSCAGTGKVAFGIGAVKEVFPEWWAVNTIPGTTDMAAAIQTADIAASGVDTTAPVAIVRFQYGDYKIGTTIDKSPFTAWLGSGNRVHTVTGGGTRLVNGQSGSMISIYSATTIYSGYSGRIMNMSFMSVFATYPAAIAVYTYGTIRQVVFENIYSRGFFSDFAGSGGELYFVRVFGNSKYSFSFLGGLGDAWFHQVNFGDADDSGAIGVQITGGGNIIFNDCRFQVCKDGIGGIFIGLQGIQFSNPIIDQNELMGLQFTNCQDVHINNPRVYDNGTIAVNGVGIYVGSNVYGVSSVDIVNNTLTFGADTGLYNLRPVRLTTTGTLPAPLTTGRDYWLIKITGLTVYKLANTRALAYLGTAIDITDVGTGTHSVQGISCGLTINGGSISDRNYPGAFQIAGLSKAAACVVTWNNHGLSNGTTVGFSGITQTQWSALNGSRVITYIDANTFSVAVNTSGFTLSYDPTNDPGTYTDATARRQSIAVKLARNGGILRNIDINGVDLAKITTAIQVTSTVDNNFRLANCTGISDMVADNGNAGKTMTEISETVQRWNTALTANRTCTLPTSGNYDGKTVKVIRTLNATGAFSLFVVDQGVTLCTHGKPGQWSEYKWSDSAVAYLLVAEGTKTGSFTCANNKDTVVTDTSITANSVILLEPTNAAAATLQGGATTLYTSAKVAGTSFTMTTANAGTAAGTETFNYRIVN